MVRRFPFPCRVRLHTALSAASASHVSTMETLLQDLRYAARRLARSRGFTVLAVLTLALGIGANSAIFGVVNAVLLRPLSFAEPDRLDRIHSTRAGTGHIPVSGPDFLQMRDETRAYEALAAYILAFPNLTGDGDPARLNGTSVSASFFDVLGVQPVVGRGFTAEENEPGRMTARRVRLTIMVIVSNLL